MGSKEDQLFHNCQKGDYDEVEKLLRGGANINAKDEYGETALHILCQKSNNVRLVKLLLDRDADNIINVKQEDEMNALHLACQYSDDIDLVRLLLNRGANVKSKDKYGCTALHCACENSKNIDLVRLLIDKGANIYSEDNVGNTALHVACFTSGNVDLVRMLLDRDFACQNANDIDLVRLNKYAYINAKEEYGYTALHFACQYSKDIDLVRLLLDSGANIHAKTKDHGFTALDRSCAAKNVNVAKLLLDRGADIHAVDNNRCQALIYACFKDIELMEEIKKSGRDVNEDVDVVALLLDRGANIHARDNDGSTGLHCACESDASIDLMRMLILQGADIHTKDNKDLTPLDYLESEEKRKEVEQLVVQKADADAKIKQFYTELLSDDGRNIDLKMNDLIAHIQNVYFAKIFYTYLSICQQKYGVITIEKRKKYTQLMLAQTAQTDVSDDDSNSMFKIILDKALEDGMIDKFNRNKLDRQAELKHTECNAQFVKDMHRNLQTLDIRFSFVEGKVQVLENKVDYLHKKVDFLDKKVDYIDKKVDYIGNKVNYLDDRVKCLHSRVNYLDDTVYRICDSVNNIKQALKTRAKVKAATGFMAAMLNAVTFGVAGPVVKGVTNLALKNVVDFSDLEHIQGVINEGGDVETMDAFTMGVAIAERIEEHSEYRFDQILLQELEKIPPNNVNKQSPIVHATLVAASISCEAKLGATAVSVSDAVLDTNTVSSADTEDIFFEKKSPKERMDDLANKIGLDFEQGLTPIQKISLLEENCGVEGVTGNLAARIKHLEEIVESW